ncbi:MAG: M28 family peptidase [Candidatus Krumholzibacteriia bacterium]
MTTRGLPVWGLLLAVLATAPAAAFPLDLGRLASARVDSARWCADVRILSGYDTLPGAVPTTQIQSRFIRGAGNGLAADWLRAELAQLGYAARFDTFLYSFNGESTLCRNVVAEAAGELHPDRFVVLGGHYDSYASGYNVDPRSLAPGAEDNASGAALVLAAARALAGLHWDLSVCFVLFSAEEQGLYGSRAFAARAAAVGDTLTAALVADMVSWHAVSPGLILDARTEHAWLAEEVAEALRTFTTVSDSVQLSPTGLVASDHLPLGEAGVPAVLLIDRDWRAYPAYHTIFDTWPLIAGKTVQGIGATRAAVATLAGLAGLHATGLPVVLRDFALRPLADGVALVWETLDLPAGSGLDVVRAAGGGWRSLTPLPLTPPPGPTRWDDTTPAPPGAERLYRLDLVTAAGARSPVTAPLAAPASAGGAGPDGLRPRLTVGHDPAADGVLLTMAGGRPGPAALRLYDLGGRLVRDLWRGWLPADGLTVPWDGRDERGRPVAAGLYLARLGTDGGEAVARVTRIR